MDIGNPRGLVRGDYGAGNHENRHHRRSLRRENHGDEPPDGGVQGAGISRFMRAGGSDGSDQLRYFSQKDIGTLVREL